MNYSDFSIWWILLDFGIPFLTVRQIAKSFNLWRDIFEMFRNASPSSLIHFTLSGFWHGTLLLILRYLGRPFYGFVGRYFSQPQFVSWALTIGSVTLGCLFFIATLA